jgi:hypothetical protein
LEQRRSTLNAVRDLLRCSTRTAYALIARARAEAQTYHPITAGYRQEGRLATCGKPAAE